MESKCPICFEDFSEKIRASPDICDHVFCLPCLERWSKSGSYCPVDRKRYKKILNLDSDVVIQVKPQKRKRHTRTLYDFSITCEVCSKDDNPEKLLLCDCCDLGLHSYCLSPPLNEVPGGQWYCPTCVKVDKKLKEAKGITKEVEADFNLKNENSNSNNKFREKQSNSIIEACHNIITEFEDITVSRNYSKDVATVSMLLTDDFNKIEKIDKSFHFNENSSSSSYPKYLKTYEKCKKNIMSTSDLVQKKIFNNKQKSFDPDELCLRNEQQTDINLLELYLSKSISYGYMKSDINGDLILSETVKHDDGCESDKNYIDGDLFVCGTIEGSESNTKEKIPETELQSKINYENIFEDSSIYKYNSRDIYPVINKDSVEEEVKRSSKSVVIENDDNLLSACKSTPEESPKGTFNNLNFEFLSESSIQVTKEKIQFSVFDKICDTNASQKKYSEINSLVHELFASQLHVKFCPLCKDMIFVKSQKYCKICKSKYFYRSIKHKKYSKYTKDSMFRNVHIGSLTDKISSNVKTCSTDVSERRQRSLLRNLQKIRNSTPKLITLSK